MFDWFVRLFSPSENPDLGQSFIVIMAAIGLGVFVGRVKFGKVSLGVAAVMFIGILLGHLGFRVNSVVLEFIRDFGLILFVYAIGIQVGFSFFASFQKEGLGLNALAVFTVLLGGAVTFVLFKFTDLGIENLVGIMSGAVTNTPGLGAAKSTLQELQDQFPSILFKDPAVAYAITYPMGVIGIISSIVVTKVLFKDANQGILKSEIEAIIHVKCRVTNSEFIGQPLSKALDKIGKRVVVSRLKHSGSAIVLAPSKSTILKERDVIMVVGREKEVTDFINNVGRVSGDLNIESKKDIHIKDIFVTKKSILHKKLHQLELFHLYDLTVTRVFRAGKEILASPSIELYYGDKITVVGTEESIIAAEKMIGNSEKKLLEPDFLSLFGGLLIGVILGSMPILIPNLPVPIKLGFAGGPLIAALFISRFGGIGVIHSYLNTSAIYFMKDLGICLFFAAVGIHAGETFYINFVKYNGWLMMGFGLVITLIPMFFLILLGKCALNLNVFQLSGLISGTFTDPAALAFSTSYLDSDVPIQTYATVYPLVTIFRILTAQVLIVLLVG